MRAKRHFGLSRNGGHIAILEIPPQWFSYPYALNYAIERCRATEFIVLLSAHALPISTTWLAEGVENMQSDPKIAGVYGFVRALPDATIWDKAFQNIPLFFWNMAYKNKKDEITKSRMGVLGFTNAVVRKNLWDQHHFNEAYGRGGEDGEWAAYWLEQGHRIVCDSKFTVMHSHYLSLWGWFQQRRHWESLGRPHPFTPLHFRKNKTHS